MFIEGCLNVSQRQVASLRRWPCEDVRGPPCLGSHQKRCTWNAMAAMPLCRYGPWPWCTFHRKSHEIHRNSSNLNILNILTLHAFFVAKLLRMKYPKVPSGAPEYCMPHGTWIWPQWKLPVWDLQWNGTKTSGYSLPSSTCLSWNSQSKEHEPNMARGCPKKKPLDKIVSAKWCNMRMV